MIFGLWIFGDSDSNASQEAESFGCIRIINLGYLLEVELPRNSCGGGAAARVSGQPTYGPGLRRRVGVFNEAGGGAGTTPHTSVQASLLRQKVILVSAAAGPTKLHACVRGETVIVAGEASSARSHLAPRRTRGPHCGSSTSPRGCRIFC